MAQAIFPYQEEGAAFLAGRQRAGLHDEMGVGKTAQIVRALNNIGAGRFFVVGPAALRENFIGEWKKFSNYPLRLCKGNNIHDYVAWQRGRFDGMVTSFELATKWYPRWREHGEFLDACVIDEGHYLKTVNAGRTRAMIGPDASLTDCWVEWSEHAWWSTGTPIPNDPMDIYTFLRFCGVMPLTQTGFMKRYFEVRRTTYGTKCTVKPEMAGELRALIDNNAIRRTKRDIGVQLPPIFLTTSLVDGDTENVKALLAQHPGLERSIVSALEQGGLSFLDAQHVSTLRRLIGEAKAVPYAHQLLEELKSTGEKRAVYGIHINALEYVRDFLVRNGVHAVLVRGGTKDVGDVVNEFQTNPNCQCFIGNIRAAGTGLTLTAACEIDMLESDWTPAGNAQAIMRVHRLGQTRNVRARFITLANSFDETVNRVVAEKTAAIAEIEGEAMTAAPPLLT